MQDEGPMSRPEDRLPEALAARGHLTPDGLARARSFLPVASVEELRGRLVEHGLVRPEAIAELFGATEVVAEPDAAETILDSTEGGGSSTSPALGDGGGRYRIGPLLGRGGMGEVIEVHEPRLRRTSP